jgi:hypothetical protein
MEVCKIIPGKRLFIGAALWMLYISGAHAQEYICTRINHPELLDLGPVPVVVQDNTFSFNGQSYPLTRDGHIVSFPGGTMDLSTNYIAIGDARLLVLWHCK